MDVPVDEVEICCVKHVLAVWFPQIPAEIYQLYMEVSKLVKSLFLLRLISLRGGLASNPG